MQSYHVSNTLVTRPSTPPAQAATFAFTPKIEYTLASVQRIAHSGSHAETGAVSDGGGITTLGSFCAVRKPCAAGCQSGVLCRFWVLVEGAPKERREPLGQRCAYARRCPEGVAAPLGCVICLQFGDVAVFSFCAQCFLNVRGGGYHYTRRAPHVLETLDGRLSKWFICRSLRSGSLH